MTTDKTALITSIQVLATVMQNIQQTQAPLARSIFLDPFTGSYPFELSTRSGSAAYTLLSKPLNEQWDGTVDNFLAFIIFLRLCAGK